MRKRKLYLNEFISRYKGHETKGTIFINGKSFNFTKFEQIATYQIASTLEIDKWTYSEEFGYIIILK